LYLYRVARTFSALQEEFEEDRALRLDREAVIVKQLTDHEQEVNERFENQIVSVLRCFRYYILRDWVCGTERVCFAPHRQDLCAQRRLTVVPCLA
jgi:hypothetical protein